MHLSSFLYPVLTEICGGRKAEGFIHTDFSKFSFNFYLSYKLRIPRKCASILILRVLIIIDVNKSKEKENTLPNDGFIQMKYI